MLLQPILALVILRSLRKPLKEAGVLAKWNRLFLVAGIVFLGLIALTIWLKESRIIATWTGHVLMAGLIYLVFTQKELKAGRAIIYALLPMMLVGLAEDSIKLINPSFQKKWENYFDVAELFAFVWMGAMLYINGRQAKALKKEQLIREEKEKEYAITQKLKAELEMQVKERTAEITRQKEELQHALDELKLTQSQLIQSEKMASLGELTAGIAHEIQNPLNFVNNFSEVNTELITEMKDAIEKGDMNEVKTLANDIADNEQKINQHGKRADAIVKGMLQHSRSSSGVKEPADINALADEYLRLAYHGLRAKDKSFNATMKTDFDLNIGKINIIPQEIGRVILNLITNAFYAVTEKKKQQPAGYEPTVSVSTRKMQGKVEIRVKDNGDGIPQKVLDKIFQPFFTTKPTGQGTGLGLSMSYDIITKGHGGTLNVENFTATTGAGAGKEDSGAEFIIILPA